MTENGKLGGNMRNGCKKGEKHVQYRPEGGGNVKGIVALRMERQHLTAKADVEAYRALYRDLQPGQNVYWNGFGQPPTLSFRADFDDLEFNRARQAERELVKGRFAGGNLGWIVPEDIELFAALYRKPLVRIGEIQERLLRMIECGGPYTIQQLKEETGFLVKEITPALHRLQEAFLIYEDQYDGAWDRGWYRFGEMFPEMNLEKYTRAEALKIVLMRYARRMVWFDAGMAKAFYRLPEKEIRAAIHALTDEGKLTARESGWMRTEDVALAEAERPAPRFVHAMHRNDVLYRSEEARLKAWVGPLCADLPYDHEPLQYLLIDGEFRGAVVGHFRNGPYDLNDVVCDLPDAHDRKDEILAAVRDANFGRLPQRFMGEAL